MISSELFFYLLCLNRCSLQLLLFIVDKSKDAFSKMFVISKYTCNPCCRSAEAEIEKVEKAISACQGAASDDYHVKRSLASLNSHKETKVSKCETCFFSAMLYYCFYSIFLM